LTGWIFEQAAMRTIARASITGCYANCLQRNQRTSGYFAPAARPRPKAALREIEKVGPYSLRKTVAGTEEAGKAIEVGPVTSTRSQFGTILYLIN
jgi:hypothetical protein